ncbi:hypothetical protein [Nonlabens sp.]|uniref:hypothetical protein n=1 Tax=Nonlabens sp. TaxID=1888209 RepID=UPI003F69AD8E
MNNKRGGIIFIALGSAIVFIGILMYLIEIFGATGMIFLGIIVELAGAYILWKHRKS